MADSTGGNIFWSSCKFINSILYLSSHTEKRREKNPHISHIEGEAGCYGLEQG